MRKKNFFSKLFNKMDKKMEEKSKDTGCCCCGDSDEECSK